MVDIDVCANPRMMSRKVDVQNADVQNRSPMSDDERREEKEDEDSDVEGKAGKFDGKCVKKGEKKENYAPRGKREAKQNDMFTVLLSEPRRKHKNMPQSCMSTGQVRQHTSSVMAVGLIVIGGVAEGAISSCFFTTTRGSSRVENAHSSTDAYFTCFVPSTTDRCFSAKSSKWAFR